MGCTRVVRAASGPSVSYFPASAGEGDVGADPDSSMAGGDDDGFFVPELTGDGRMAVYGADGGGEEAGLGFRDAASGYGEDTVGVGMGEVEEEGFGGGGGAEDADADAGSDDGEVLLEEGAF